MAVKSNARLVANDLKRFKRQLRARSVQTVNLAAQVTKAGISSSIRGRQKIDGTRRGNLDRDTIRQKRRKNYSRPTVPLLATGMMQNVLISKVATKASPTAELKPAAGRENVGDRNFDVAAHHQKGRYGPWFGITKRARLRTEKFHEQLIVTELQRFNRGNR